ENRRVRRRLGYGERCRSLGAGRGSASARTKTPGHRRNAPSCVPRSPRKRRAQRREELGPPPPNRCTPPARRGSKRGAHALPRHARRRSPSRPAALLTRPRRPGEGAQRELEDISSLHRSPYTANVPPAAERASIPRRAIVWFYPVNIHLTPLLHEFCSPLTTPRLSSATFTTRTE